MAIKQNIPGTVDITTISLFSKRGTVNIDEHVHSLSIFESIFTPGIIAELGIWDTKNLSTILPILGGERLTIELETPGRKALKYDLQITEMRDAVPADNMRSKAYILTAATPEVLRNQATSVTKAYNTTISSMIEDITKSYLKTNKKINVQKSKGVQKIIVPNLKPFDAVTMLRKRAISVDDKSSAYVYFENREGFHFKTLEKLMSSGSVGDRVFTNDPTIDVDITRSTFRNVISYELPEQFDVVNRLDRGGMSQEVSKFDYKTLKYERRVERFDPKQFRNPDGTLNDPDGNELKALTKEAGHHIWVNHDSGNPDTFLSEGLGLRSSGSSILGQGNLLIHVYGDSELTAGQLIEMKMLNNSSADELPEEHKQLSGKYLIAFIHHAITQEGSNPRYTCSIEAIKGGYKESV